MNKELNENMWKLDRSEIHLLSAVEKINEDMGGWHSQKMVKTHKVQIKCMSQDETPSDILGYQKVKELGHLKCDMEFMSLGRIAENSRILYIENIVFPDNFKPNLVLSREKNNIGELNIEGYEYIGDSIYTNKDGHIIRQRKSRFLGMEHNIFPHDHLFINTDRVKFYSEFGAIFTEIESELPRGQIDIHWNIIAKRNSTALILSRDK